MTTTRDSIHDVWGLRTPYVGEGQWPVRVDERTLEEPERALDIGVRDGRIVGVRGRPQDRVNRGRLGPQGMHGWIANHSHDRLKKPMVRKDGALVATSWDDAMERVAKKTRELLDEHGSGAIGFYNTGQLFLEEYDALSMIARAGIKTNHLDGNTRLCTSTAAMALIESFGSDGDPGTYEDYDVTDAILLVGHNMAETQTVLWSRLLDRRRGPRRPALVVVDPRRTPTAMEADLHLRPRVGTNVALLNGILHLWIRDGRIDNHFIAEHTTGFAHLEKTVAAYTPSRVEAITQVPQAMVLRAAQMLGDAPSLVSSCLQGVYPSHQATAAAVQVNNLHLVRGLIGKPGSTVFQMNGQPTAQNTRECGANGELAAFLNYANPPPTHIMQMLRYAEEGALRMLWIVCTNPAVSLPELARIRRILEQHSLFVVVQDAFPTETTRHTDVVLPAAMWAEKTGTFTNADRTVHISHKAIEPPGEARSDFDIFVDYARRMGFRDKHGGPLLPFRDVEGAFNHFKALTKDRPCDYSGISYEKLTGGSGIQWPCNEAHPEGQARLYVDAQFHTAASDCETFGHDLVTGAVVTPEEYRARDLGGRAHLKPAPYIPPPEEPDDSFPLWLTTGRTVDHFHTRTKTGRAPKLVEAAPEPVVEMSVSDATRFGVAEGDVVIVESRRGGVRVKVKIADILDGHVFMPFHYGTLPTAVDVAPAKPATAANELTLTSAASDSSRICTTSPSSCTRCTCARWRSGKPRRRSATTRSTSSATSSRPRRTDRPRGCGRRSA